MKYEMKLAPRAAKKSCKGAKADADFNSSAHNLINLPSKSLEIFNHKFSD